jgi:hypothetical protein
MLMPSTPTPDLDCQKQADAHSPSDSAAIAGFGQSLGRITIAERIEHKMYADLLFHPDVGLAQYGPLSMETLLAEGAETKARKKV